MATVGFGQADITPDIGLEMGGFPLLGRKPLGYSEYRGRQGPSIGTHDPLLATAAVIETADGGTAIVTLDVLSTTSALTAKIRSAVAHSMSIEERSVFVAASHTHSGPDLYEGRRDEGTEARIVDGAFQAVAHARETAAPSTLEFGVGAIDYISVNRIDEDRGPHDPSVRVIVARAAGTRYVRGVIMSYACHPLTLGPPNCLYSADFVHYLRVALERLYPQAPVVYLNGAAGNVQPARFPYEQRANISFSFKAPVVSAWADFRDAERFGTSLAGEAAKAIERALPLQEGEIDSRRQDVSLPAKEEQGLLDFCELIRVERATLGVSPEGEILTEVQAIRIGDIALIGLPGEPFVEVGRAIADRSWYGTDRTLVVGYANDNVWYILPEAQYATLAGNYESQATILAKPAAEILVSGALEIAEDMR